MEGIQRRVWLLPAMALAWSGYVQWQERHWSKAISRLHAEASRLSVEWQAVEERAIGLAEIEIGRRFNEFAERRLAHLEQSVTETMANRERMEGQRLEASMTMTATRFGNGLMKLYELERRIEALENRTQ